MRFVLSRKGFDSRNGGYPSLIIDDRRLVSLPVPSRRVEMLPYSKLHFDKNTTYFDVMSQLREGIKIKGKREILTKNTRCHSDPDICRNTQRREDGWRGCFGQGGKAQTHLGSRIREMDVFLFFGWFKNVIRPDGKYTFDKSSRSRHVIFGYLQVGERFHPNSPGACAPPWMKSHPHILHKGSDQRNTIYVATEELSWNKSLPGWGVFYYNKKLILTKEGYSKSKWSLPSFFEDLNITYHSRTSWKEDYFQSADIGQEFVIEENDRVTDWAQGLIDNCATRHAYADQHLEG